MLKGRTDLDNIIRYNPDIKNGLTPDQIADRRENGLANHHPQTATKSIWNIVKDNVFTLFNGINFTLAIALFAVGSYKNMLFMAIVLINIFIGIVQEVRSKKQVEKLSLITMPRAVVVRSGAEEEIQVEELVLDDVMVLRLGRQVCSDSIVMDGEVEVNEALLKGEADPVIKRVGDTLMSGSFVVSGECFALADKVGKDNYAVRIAESARKYRKLKSQLMTDLKKIIKFDSIIIIPLGLAMLFQNFFVLKIDSISAVSSVSAALIGMIPEGLMLLTSVSLAVSVVKLARKKTLVQELYCIESLSRVDMLCLDKTGTLTQGEMEVSDVYCAVAQSEFDGYIGKYLTHSKDSNQTSDALRKHFNILYSNPAKSSVSFSSSRKYGGIMDDENQWIVLGSPEKICGDRYSDVSEKVTEYAKNGLRVVAVGVTHSDISQGLPTYCRLLGLVAIEDKIRKEAAKTLKFFKDEGVHIKIISGDNPVTVANVSRRAGVDGWEKYIDVTGMDDIQLKDAVMGYNVFGRVNPDQKKKMICFLKEQGHTVAMTGDGINDVMALKMADCSIAMASGSDGARQVSHLVLLENDFSVLPSVVMEGRRVINNINRTASLYLVKTLFSFMLAVITVVTAAQYPFMPLHFSVISSFGVGIPTFFLALEPNRERIRGRFLATVLQRAVPGAFVCLLYVGISSWMCDILGMGQSSLSTMAFILTGGVTLIILLKTCIPLSKIRGILFTLMVTGFTATAVFGRSFLGLVAIPPASIALIAICILIAYPLLDILERWSAKISKRFFKEDVFNG